MKMRIEGPHELPFALLIHPELTDDCFFDQLSATLSDRYRLVIPTLDGHYPESPNFTTPPQQAQALAELLRDSEVEHADLVLGCGVGAIVALNLVSELGQEFAGRIVLDSAPVFEHGIVMRKLMERRLERAARLSASDPDRLVRVMPNATSAHLDIMARVAGNMSHQTLANVTSACFAEPLPNLTARDQRRITFTWGRRDLAGRGHARVARHYPYADVVIRGLYGSCGLITHDPNDFARAFLLPDCEQYRERNSSERVFTVRPQLTLGPDRRVVGTAR